MNKRLFPSLLVLVFLCLLLLFPKEALIGGKSGLLLWFQTILPTLLPFLIVSNLIVQLNLADIISSFLYPVLKHFLPISKNGCYPILIGMLSGYPIGAKTCGDLVKMHKISKKEGQFLLSLCNNASPMFLISFLALQSLQCPEKTHLIFILIFLGAILSSLGYYFIDFLFSKYKKNSTAAPEEENFLTTFSLKEESNFLEKPRISFSELLDFSILKSFEVITKIGGYIILFSILAQIFSELPFLPKMISFCMTGCLEITTGIYTICQSSIPMIEKIVLTMAITSFGGLSSLAQTKSVLIGSGLSIKIYAITKLCNALLVALLSFFLF